MLLILLLTAWIILISLWAHSRWKRLKILQQCGIPGPPPNFIFGNMLEWRFSGELSLHVMEKWKKKYGNIYGFYLGLQPRIVIEDLDMLRTLFVKEIDIFTNRPDILAVRPRSVLVARDQNWKRIRQHLTPVFTQRKLKCMFPIFSQCCDILSEDLTESCDKHAELDISQKMQALSMDVIFKCAMAIDMDIQRKWNDDLPTAIRTLISLPFTYVFYLIRLFPGLTRIFHVTVDYLPMMKHVNLIHDRLRKIIGDRRSGKLPKVDDILQLMLNLSDSKHNEDGMDKSTQHDKASQSMTEELLRESEQLMDRGNQQEAKAESRKELQLSDEDILSNCTAFLLAGYETTSSALSFIIYCLAKHPEAQEKIYREIETCLKSDQEISYEALGQMIFMEQVINEGLRLYPPVPLFVTREAKEDYRYGGILIPKGSVVEVPVYSIHHNPEYWPNPDIFLPERFSPENKDQRLNSTFLPFGFGPRMCIGARFAMLEMKFVLTRLIRKFVIKPGPNKFRDEMDLMTPSFLMRASHGIWVSLERRGPPG